MKTVTVFLCLLCLAAPGFATLANAALQDNGNGLIYDTDLNITWYDYAKSPNTWNNQVAWAEGLTVGGVTGWRLPRSIDGSDAAGYDGTTTAGWNVTSSEMGHLFYTELGNNSYYDVNGNPQTGYGLVNKGPFTDLISDPDLQHSYIYWSDTVYSAQTQFGWGFLIETGYQGVFSRC